MTIDEMGGKEKFYLYKMNKIYFEEAVDNFLK